jgi:copper transport protein
MRVLRVSLLTGFLVVLSFASGSAHAYVVRAQPAMNGSYENPAGAIAISFDEPIDVLDANAIEVFDAKGTRVDKHDAAIDAQDAARVVVHVPMRLDSGAYRVDWRVVSADTHVVHGSYVIGVGAPAAALAAPNNATVFDPSAPLATTLRLLGLLGALLAAGAVFVRSLMLDRLASVCRNGPAVARRAVTLGAVVVLVAALPSLVVQSAAAGGALGADIVPTLLHSAWGGAFIVRIVAGLALFAVATFSWWGSSSRVVALGAALVLLVTFCVTGHALSDPSPISRAFSLGFDCIHVAAAATWVGGIFVLTMILFDSSTRSQPMRMGDLAWMLFAQFTPIAIGCVCIVVASGIYASIVHVGSLSNLVGSIYGRLLLAKIAGVVALLLLGYRHMRLGTGRIAGSGRATLVGEAIVGVAVVAFTAILVGQMPPGHMVNMEPPFAAMQNRQP